MPGANIQHPEAVARCVGRGRSTCQCGSKLPQQLARRCSCFSFDLCFEKQAEQRRAARHRRRAQAASRPSRDWDCSPRRLRMVGRNRNPPRWIRAGQNREAMLPIRKASARPFWYTYAASLIWSRMSRNAKCKYLSPVRTRSAPICPAGRYLNPAASPMRCVVSPAMARYSAS